MNRIVAITAAALAVVAVGVASYAALKDDGNQTVVRQVTVSGGTPTSTTTAVSAVTNVYNTASKGVVEITVNQTSPDGQQGQALVVDGELVGAAEEERFNRVKHCAGLPGAGGARGAWPRRGLSRRTTSTTSRSAATRGRTSARSSCAPLRHGASPRYLKARLENAARVRDVKARARGGARRREVARRGSTTSSTTRRTSRARSSSRRSRTRPSSRSTGSATSPRRCSPRATARRFEVLDRVLFPHSLGIFYTAVTQWLGFPSYGDEGKVMGLAPYGDAALPRARCAQLVRPTGDLFELGLDYFTHHKEGVE